MSVNNPVCFWRFQQEVNSLYIKSLDFEKNTKNLSKAEIPPKLQEINGKVDFLLPSFEVAKNTGFSQEEGRVAIRSLKKFNEILFHRDLFPASFEDNSLGQEKVERIWRNFITNNSAIEAISLFEQVHGKLVKQDVKRLNVRFPNHPRELPSSEKNDNRILSDTDLKKESESDRNDRWMVAYYVGGAALWGNLIFFKGLFPLKINLIAAAVGGLFGWGFAPQILQSWGQWFPEKVFLDGKNEVVSVPPTSIHQFSLDPEKKDLPLLLSFASCVAFFDLFFNEEDFPASEKLEKILSNAVQNGAKRVIEQKKDSPSSILGKTASDESDPWKNVSAKVSFSANESFHYLDVLQVQCARREEKKGFLVSDVNRSFCVIPNSSGPEVLLGDFQGINFSEQNAVVQEMHSPGKIHNYPSFFFLASDLYRLNMSEKTRVFQMIPQKKNLQNVQ